MTYRERLAKEFPSKINAAFNGGCSGCPTDYWPEARNLCDRYSEDRDKCDRCWGQSVPAVEAAAPSRAALLAAAEKCVCHDREDQYGNLENNFASIAKYWTIWIDGRAEITAHDVGVMQALLKVARIQSGRVKDDNYVDGIGYLACAGEIALKEEGK